MRSLDTSDHVTIVEVGARDGLQNEAVTVPTAAKVELLQRLVGCGLRAVEVTSFVRADRIPQLADADEVARAYPAVAGGRAIALAPNVAGLQRALAAGIREVAVFAAASDAFNERNVGRPTQAALEMFRPVAEMALEHGVRVRGYVSTVAGCPYQGAVPLHDVVAVAEALVALGCHEISLGDTIGVGTPTSTLHLVRAVSQAVPVEQLAVHMHDTYGMGLVNSMVAIEAGVRIVDTSVGGLGGCPYAGPGARGNLATEDLVYALDDASLTTGVDLEQLVEVSWWLSELVGRQPTSRVALAKGGPACRNP